MTERDAQRAAEFLGTHAVLLLALGLAAALAALAVVAGAVGVLRRHRSAITGSVLATLRHLPRVNAVDRLVERSRALVPSGALAVHLMLGLALTAAVLVFAVIAENVVARGEIVAFDLAFAKALRDAATPEWERFFAGVSRLGQREVLAAGAAVVAVRLLVAGNVLIAAAWIVAQAGGGVLNMALKESFERTRPAFADPLLAASSWSFPSGHAMGTFILCGLGCYLLLRDVRSWAAATLTITVALAWCVVMAFSRLYLGVHFASDVVAGLIAGVAWVAVCASAIEMIRRTYARPATSEASTSRDIRSR